MVCFKHRLLHSSKIFCCGKAYTIKLSNLFKCAVQSRLLLLKFVLWTDLNLTGGLYKHGVIMSVEERNEKSLNAWEPPNPERAKFSLLFLKKKLLC